MKDGITEIELDARGEPRLVIAGDMETLRALAAELSRKESKSGPWTRHGHAVSGVTIAGERPPLVARCGGPALCSQCREDAERLQREKESG